MARAEALTPAQRQHVLDALAHPDATARLAPIEVAVIEGLRERPTKTWCRGCDHLLQRLAAKAQVPIDA